MSNNEQQSNRGGTERGADRPAVSRVRRRLVKSALAAAPVVLTLRSGAAAATASAYQCIETDQAQAQNLAIDPLVDPETGAADPPDSLPWFRSSLPCRKLSKGGKEFWVFEDPSNPGQWVHEDDPTRRFTGGDPMAEIGGSGGFQVITDNEQCGVLAHFGPTGDIIGYGKASSPDNLPITYSCWTSIDPAWANMNP